MQVDGDEPRAVARQPRDRVSDDVGDGHDVVGGDLAIGKLQHAWARRARSRRRDDLDAASIKQRLDGVGRSRPEDLKRALLWRDDPHRGAGAVLAQLVRRQQSELVQRQRPDRRPRQREGDARVLATQVALDELAQGRRRVCARAEGQRPRERLDAAGAGREREHVVGHPPAAAGEDGLLRGVDRDERVEHDARAEVAGDLRPFVALRCAALEGLGDGHRARDELDAGGQQGDRDAPGSEHAQREHELQRGDAAAGDQHPGSMFALDHELELAVSFRDSAWQVIPGSYAGPRRAPTGLSRAHAT